MSILKELIAKHSKVPGDIKVKSKEWHVDSYFIPYFEDAVSGHIHGLNPLGVLDSFYSICSDDWEIYTEPKKKTKLYQYVYKSIDENRWRVCLHYFKNDQAFLHYLMQVNLNTQFLRLDFSMIEVDDE